MKNIFAAILIIAFSACNNSNKESTTTEDSATSEIGGVENVTGNIPDTSAMGATPNSGSNQVRVDSTYADTAKKSNR